MTGDVDIGIVGYDMLREIGNEDEDLVIVHDALGFGRCHLAVAVPQAWDNVTFVRPFEIGPDTEGPLRRYGVRELPRRIFKDQGNRNVVNTTADG